MLSDDDSEIFCVLSVESFLFIFPVTLRGQTDVKNHFDRKWPYLNPSREGENVEKKLIVLAVTGS